MTTEKLFEKMKTSDIFLFTSNYQEGWGAILNEAMNAGCVCICSHAPGSVPFIINDKNNGLIYHCGNINELYKITTDLINSRDLMVTIGQNAYLSIINEWNYKTAAKKLLELAINFKKSGKITCYEKGVLSKADIIKNKWYKEK